MTSSVLRRPIERSVLLSSVLLLGVSVAGQAACAPEPVAGEAFPGVDRWDEPWFPAHWCLGTAWDPDGPGPLGERLVVAGDFSVAGDVAAEGIAAYDPATGAWMRFGPAPGLPGIARSGPNGELFFATQDLWTGAVTLRRWTGSQWLTMGIFDRGVTDVVVMPSGDVVVSGSFRAVGATPVAGLARWDGTAWGAFGDLWVSQIMAPSNLPPIPVNTEGSGFDLELLANGELVVAGLFTSIGGVQANHVARWDGAAWHPYGARAPGAWVSQVEEHNGQLLARGPFGSLGGFVVWAGGAWQPFPQLPPSPGAMLVTAAGELMMYADDAIRRWTPTGWVDLPWSPTPIGSLVVLAGGEIFVTGDFDDVAGARASRVARLDGEWGPLASGTDGPMLTVVRMADGDFVVGGSFTSRAGSSSNGLARFDGAAWSDITATTLSPVTALANAPNGEALALGSFAFPNATPARPIARIVGDGTQPMPGGAFWFLHVPLCLSTAPDGRTWIGCRENASGAVVIARWDGVALTTTTVAGLSGELRAMLHEPNGDVLLGGAFSTATGAWQAVRWDGNAVTGEVRGLSGAILALQRDADGVLYCGGTFDQQGYFGRQSGTTLVPVVSYPQATSGPVHAIERLPTGDLVVGSRLVTRGRGTTWRSLAWVADQVRDVVVAPDGTIAVVGDFGVAGVSAGSTLPSAHFLRLVPPCPATVGALGSGCQSAVGPVGLTASGLPWIGTTLSTTTSNVPAGGVLLQLLGSTTAAQPLGAVFPQAGAGCVVSVRPDLLLPAVFGGGDVVATLPIPAAASLVGGRLYLQSFPVDLGPGGLAGISASNALELTFGAL